MKYRIIPAYIRVPLGEPSEEQSWEDFNLIGDLKDAAKKYGGDVLLDEKLHDKVCGKDDLVCTRREFDALEDCDDTLPD